MANGRRQETATHTVWNMFERFTAVRCCDSGGSICHEISHLLSLSLLSTAECLALAGYFSVAVTLAVDLTGMGLSAMVVSTIENCLDFFEEIICSRLDFYSFLVGLSPAITFWPFISGSFVVSTVI